MSRVFRCVVQQEILVVVDGRAHGVHIEAGLVQVLDPRRAPGSDGAINRVDPEAIIRDAIELEDAGNVVDIVAGASEIVTDFKELT
jgi:hypothetical protein